MLDEPLKGRKYAFIQTIGTHRDHSKIRQRSTIAVRVS